MPTCPSWDQHSTRRSWAPQVPLLGWDGEQGCPLRGLALGWWKSLKICRKISQGQAGPCLHAAGAGEPRHSEALRLNKQHSEADLKINI